MTMKNLLLMLLCMLFPACMHLPMMGTGTDHQTSTLEKEITLGDTRANAIFPPLRMGKETLITLMLADLKTGKMISGANVSFHVEYLDTDSVEKAHGGDRAHHGSDSTNATPRYEQHDVDLPDVNETEAGHYIVRFSPSQSGDCKLMFHLGPSGDHDSGAASIIEATRNVSSESMDHDAGMHGMGGSTTSILVGVGVMGAMMLVLWLTRGGMF